MFLISKQHLIDTLKLPAVGFTIVHTTQGNYTASKEARVFSIPNRSVAAQSFQNQRERVERYSDPTDLNPLGKPKIKERILKADFSTTFLVTMTNRTAVLLNEDFKNFLRNIGKFIGDGQTATRIGEKGDTRVDNKGNLIAIILGNVNFNDNQFYKEIKNWVGIEVTFSGGIYLDPDPEPGAIEMPDPGIEIDNVTTP